MLSPENVQRATNIDGALRNFIEEKQRLKASQILKNLTRIHNLVDS